MLILALDTSGDVCSVAVTQEATLLSEYNFAHHRKLTERLPGIVEFVLRDAGVSLEEIDAFAVGIGPGSFTGVRVGVTMAKTWADVFQKPLVGISSLLALATQVPTLWTEPYGIIAVVPSRKGEVIAEIWQGPTGTPILEATALPTDAVLDHCRAILGEKAPVIVVGECTHWISAEPGIEHEYRSPRASYIALLARQRISFDSSDDPATLVPLYIAPPPIRGGKLP